MEKITSVRPVQNKKGRLVGVAAVVGPSAVAASNAMAITAADIGTATADTGAESTISAGQLWVLGIIIVLFVGRKILGMFGR
ncbi:hypothetical protein [Acinetobacter ursingii]|uniref:hypothetical protein n=1 Tax=Acinetobacter ursingii TaxID=108980 RepID=UPI00124FBF3A|nr:hypothetical protein [Acinetobacter ursingii]